MSDLKRRLERLEDERGRRAGTRGSGIPLVRFCLAASEPGPAGVAEWIAGYEAEREKHEACQPCKCYSFSYVHCTVSGTTCDGKRVQLRAEQYYVLAKEGRRIDSLSANSLEEWVSRNGFKAEE